LYFGLIPAWGAMGAALATLGGFAFHAALTLIVSQRVFWVHYETQRLLAMAGLGIMMWLGSRCLPVAPWAAMVKAVCWLGLPGVLWLTGLISPEEKRWARSFAVRAISRWQRWSPERLAAARERSV
jgi:hypothetical protein